jgi:hypothetical protein
MCAAALLLAGSGAIAIAQKVATPEDLDKVMKRAGPALEASGKAIGGSAYTDAKPQLAALKQAIDDSREFWVEHKRDDAIKFNKDTRRSNKSRSSSRPSPWTRPRRRRR